MDQQYLKKWVIMNCPSIPIVHNTFTFKNNISPMTIQIKRKKKKSPMTIRNLEYKKRKYKAALQANNFREERKKIMFLKIKQQL